MICSSFNPRPAHPRGATCRYFPRSFVRPCFNPRPAHPRGATSCYLSIREDTSSFQSAPRAPARGDFTIRARFTRCMTFQSAPRAPARGDMKTKIALLILSLFQSAPRAPARGDTSLSTETKFMSRFNPRPAHPRGATFQSHVNAGISYFVSIRAPRTRAGRLRCCQQAAPQSFNIPFPRTGRVFARLRHFNCQRTIESVSQPRGFCQPRTWRG